MSSNAAEFEALTASLQKPLPTEAGEADKLRSLVAEAEAYGVLISQYLRTLSSHIDQETAKQLAELREDDVYKSSNADEKKLLLAARVADLKAKHTYAENLEGLIKRRVTVGQSFLKSFNELN